MSRDGFNSVITKTLGDCSIDEHHSEDEEGDSSTFMETDRLLNVQLCTSTVSFTFMNDLFFLYSLFQNFTDLFNLDIILCALFGNIFYLRL